MTILWGVGRERAAVGNERTLAVYSKLYARFRGQGKSSYLVLPGISGVSEAGTGAGYIF